MSFFLLFKDELTGFYKSKVMIFLWIGLPLMAVLLHLWSPYTGEEMPFTLLSTLLVSSIGGTLAAVMLAVSIVHEKSQHVYDLFLVRPLKRWYIVASKFFAVYTCIAIASILTLIMGIVIDYFVMGGAPAVILNEAIQSLSVSLSMMAVSSSAGVLIGVVAPSVLVGVIVMIYGGNQISALPLLPSMLNISNPVPFTLVLGAVTSCVLLLIAVLVFSKKQF